SAPKYLCPKRPTNCARWPVIWVCLTATSGWEATEREVKRLSDRGELAAYRIVHFATHGALAGELKAGAEPGLILTPPSEATPEDDGYLSASEIAGLKLDADWVILSACNTAAGATAPSRCLASRAPSSMLVLVRCWSRIG